MRQLPPSSLRDVPSNQETIKLLDEYIATFRSVQRIFEGLSNTAANKALKRLVGRDVHVQSLRYTYVFYLISQGVELFAISKLIGHKDLNTTLSVYAHLLEESKQENNGRVRNIFGAELGKNIAENPCFTRVFCYIISILRESNPHHKNRNLV